MKFTPLSGLAFTLFVAPCASSLVKEESDALDTWGAATIQRAGIPEDTEWVSRRQAARTHMRELLGEELREVEKAASSSPHLSATRPGTNREHNDFPTDRPLEGRMAPRAQKADQIHSAQPKLASAQKKLRQPTVVSESNVAAERIAKQTQLADKLSQWHKMQKAGAFSATTVAPHAHVKRVAKSRTPLTERYRNRRSTHQTNDSQVAKEKVVEVEAKETPAPAQTEPPKSTKSKAEQRMATQEEATHMKAQDKVGNAKVTSVKVTDVKVADVQPTAQEDQEALPKAKKVGKAKVTEVKVVDVKVVENVKSADVERMSQQENSEGVAKMAVVAKLEAKVKDDKVKEAYPESARQAAEMPKHNKIEAQVVDAQKAGAHVAVPETTRSLLSCVCGGKFGQGDRVQYVGHAFPTGRSAGTILAGTKNGYLNIEWDNFHEGHTGNCQLSSCGSCEKSTVNSRWFAACSDVEILEEAQTAEEGHKLRIADLVFGSQ